MRRHIVMIMVMLASLQLSIAQELPLNITPVEAAKMVSDKTVVLIDIRTPEEWVETGVAEGAIRIDMNDPNFLPKFRDATGNDRSKPVALICRTASRTRTVQAALIQQGIHTKVMNVEGGMLGNSADKGWIARGLPVKKGD